LTCISNNFDVLNLFVLMIFDDFDVLILKIKKYFDVFQIKNIFEKYHTLEYQTYMSTKLRV